jgi:hypothetical protein
LVAALVAACSATAPGQEPAALSVARSIAAQGSSPALATLLAPAGEGLLPDADAFTSPGWRLASAGRFDALGARLGSTAGAPFDVGVSQVERLRLRLTREGVADVPATADRGRLVYEDAWPASDAILAASETSFEEAILVHDATAPREFAWQIELPSGISGVRDDGAGGLFWLDSSGDLALHLPRPVALDAAGNARPAAVRFDAGRLVVSYDPAGATFPLLIDPAFETAFWVRAQPATSPPARTLPAMSYDATRGVTVLFGGQGQGDLDDTWEWDGTSWTQQCATSPCNKSGNLPTPRPGAAMAFDPVHAVTLLFGGGENAMEQNDTWTWNGTAWTDVCAGTAACTPPTPRTQSSLVFYAGSGRAVLFGGEQNQCDSNCPPDCGPSPLDETWTWNGATWTQEKPTTMPPARYGAVIVEDTTIGAPFLFGGFTPGSFTPGLADSWTWNASTAAWTPLCAQAPCVPPPARGDQAMAFDTTTKKTVVFGGSTNVGNPTLLADTWQWDGSAWSGVTAASAPSPRDQAGSVYDAKRARVVVFGGEVAGTPVAETWEYHSNGAACTADAQCDTGHCVDGVCCETTCGACQACDQVASLEPGPPSPGPVATPGVCSAVTNAQDPDSCTGGMTCDADGQCKAASGRTCTVPSDCASGSCIGGCCDGVSPCVPPDAGVDGGVPPSGDGGSPSSSGGATPGGSGGKGGGCGCRAVGGEGGGGGGAGGPWPPGALLVAAALLVVARRGRSRRALAGVAGSCFAAACSLVTPLDSLDSQHATDGGAGAVDAAADVVSPLHDGAPDAPRDASLDTAAPVPDAAAGADAGPPPTPPGHPASWSLRFGDSQDQHVYAVAADSAGDLFVAGAFAGSIDFGGGHALASSGGDDAFVAMLDPQGTAVWAKSFGDAADGGANPQRAYGLAVDAAGDVFVCGAFAGTLLATASPVPAEEGLDAFVVKLDATGTVQWVKAFAGPGDQSASGIAADAMGNTVVEGAFEYSMAVNGTTFPSTGGFDAFTVRLNANGNPLWTTTFGGPDDQLGTSVGIADSGAPFTTGSFGGRANVGATLDAGVATSAGGYDVFLASFAPNNGSPGVVAYFGDPADQYGYALAVDSLGSGHVVVAGPFAGTLTFGAQPLVSAGLHDVFVARFDLSGAPAWGVRIGDPQEQIAYGAAIDLGGNVLVAGSLQGTATFGSETVVGAGGDDALLAKLDPDGKPLWIDRFGDPSEQTATAVTTTLAGGAYDVVLAGNFEGTIDLGAGPLTSQGGSDFFLAVFPP